MGLQIDNCEVWVDQPEMPGCDGSSLPFVECLDRAGIVTQNAWRDQIVVRETSRVGADDAWIEAKPHAGLALRYRLDYGLGNGIGRQTFDLELTPENLPSRQFAQPHAFCCSKRKPSGSCRKASRRSGHDQGSARVTGDHGPIDNELRFEDECVRHKMLDLLGDLALTGCDMIGQFAAHRSGHRLNSDMARVLLQEGQRLEYRRRTA